MDSRNYVILNSGDLEKVIFSQILQSSSKSLRYNLDQSKFLISYTGDQPYFIFSSITNDAIGLPEYSQEEITNILLSPEWSVQISGITL
jgi:hypothetical protein